MICSDEEGQAKFDEILKKLDWGMLNSFEKAFISDMQYKGIRFKHMTQKQKALVLEVYDKL